MSTHDEPKVLVLWDIDHTLIETRGVGAELYRAAFEETTGAPMDKKAEVTGLTEPAIFRETMRLNGLREKKDDLGRYVSALGRQYELSMSQLRDRGLVLPGAREALAALQRVDGVIQAVLSGNLRTVSRAKLATFDLDHYLDLEVSAYGDDDEERPSLVNIAQRRAEAKYKQEFGCQNTVIIGDSPSDVDTGRRGGAHVIGVASGKSDAAELKSAGADLAIDGLDDTARVVDAVRKAVST